MCSFQPAKYTRMPCSLNAGSVTDKAALSRSGLKRCRVDRRMQKDAFISDTLGSRR